MHGLCKGIGDSLQRIKRLQLRAGVLIEFEKSCLLKIFSSSLSFQLAVALNLIWFSSLCSSYGSKTP